MNMNKAYDVAGQMYDLMSMYTYLNADEIHHVLSCLHRIIHKEMELNNEIDDEV
jgi:hypothetical protein